MGEGHSSILVVDDDAEDLLAVERVLRSLGSDLRSVRDPHEVLPSVHRHRPDLVIMDALLPGLSGFDLCKQIKSDPQLKSTQVLILTGVYLRQQYRQEALQQFKADAFLTKPFRPPELQRIVVQLLARKTRVSQSTFLKRMGLPVSGEPRKRGLFGRLFGRGEAEPELETLGIAPSPSDSSPALGKGKSSEGAKATVRVPATDAIEEVERPKEIPVAVAGEPPPAPTTQPDGSPANPEPFPEAAARPQEGTESPAAAAIGLPPPAKPVIEEADGLREPASETPQLAEAEPEPVEERPADETAPPEIVNDEGEGPSAAEGENVIWVEADARAPDLSLDEIAARIAAGEAAKASGGEAVAASPPEGEPAAPVESEVEPDVEPESEPLEERVPVRRPRRRVGDVPIYEENDFLTELKRELSKCRRVDRPLTLILIRVGDLPQILELFGKDFREPVLWHVAERAMQSLREVDLVGMMSSRDRVAMTAFASDRYGGGRIVSRMRQAVAKNPFRVGEGLPPIVPMLDFGMASFPADGIEVTSLLERAESDLPADEDGSGSAA